jgi:hypothetical protein
MADSSFKIPSFDGKADKFSMWWHRFKAFAAMKEFLPAIQAVQESDMPNDEGQALDASVAAEALQLAAKKRNGKAMAALTMAFTSPKLMMMVTKACTVDWPGGLAYLVVVQLFKRFRPQDTISKVELRMRLNRVAMKASDEPCVLFQQLAEIQELHESNNTPVDESDLMAVVFTVAPEKYHRTVTTWRSFGARRFGDCDGASVETKQGFQDKKSGSG